MSCGLSCTGILATKARVRALQQHPLDPDPQPTVPRRPGRYPSHLETQVQAEVLLRFQQKQLRNLPMNLRLNQPLIQR